MAVIAVVFDFDDTLVPDSTTALLESRGVDAAQFWSELIPPLGRRTRALNRRSKTCFNNDAWTACNSPDYQHDADLGAMIRAAVETLVASIELDAEQA